MSSIGSAPGGTDRPTLLVVGAASRDVDRTDARGWRLGGSVTYCSLAAARLGLCVRALIGADAPAATASELGLLHEAGVDVRLVPLRAGPVFHNRTVGSGRFQLARQASDPLPPAAVPVDWRDTSAVLLVPVAGELGELWANVPAPTAFVGLGWQGLFRRLDPGRPVERLPLRANQLAARADIAVVSAEDATGGGASLTALLSRPGQQLAVTHGPRGAVLVERTADDKHPLSVRRVPPIATDRAIDQTGAGDVFLAAWCAARIVASAAAPWRQMAIASAAGSATAEARQLTDLPDVGRLRKALLTRPTSRVRAD